MVLNIPLKAYAQQNYNQTGILTCVQSLANCTLSIVGMNPNATDYSPCISPFTSCLSTDVFNDLPPTPLECYLADAAWENLYISIGAFSGILLVNNFILPAALKGGANLITKMMNLNEEEHPYLRRVGRFLGYFTDGNRDGVVTANELLNPQALVTFASLALPFYYWYIANDKQAECDFAWAMYKFINPLADDDDLFHEQN